MAIRWSRGVCAVRQGKECRIHPMLQGVRGPALVVLTRSNSRRAPMVVAQAVDRGDSREEMRRVSSSRRSMVVSSGATALVASLGVECDPAAAFSLGISGPKEWLREQKKRTWQFLVAPIVSSRGQLQSAVALLMKADGVTTGVYREAGELVKRASRDCLPPAAGSVIDLQSRSGIQVCTFRLILKNAASLLDKADPVKLKAHESLDELIRSFNTLAAVLADGAAGDTVDRTRLVNAVRDAKVALDVFEGGVRECLGIGAA